MAEDSRSSGSDASIACPQCGRPFAPALNACPLCHALLHRDRLAQLASEADAATEAGQLTEAVALWRQALPLLPPRSSQREAVGRKIDELTSRTPPPQSGTRWGKGAGVGALLLGLLGKGKLLLIGLTKLPTLLSMLAFAGVYWTLWGWKFALAVVVGIYIHEMGHVSALTRRGLPASAPMFIPGFGAFVRLHSAPATPREDARIGLAGPIWGLAAALAAALTFVLTRNGIWSAVAHTTAVINLFNLTPVWDLDGSRGLRSFTVQQRWMAFVLLAVTWAFTREGMLVIIALGMAWSAFRKHESPVIPDWGAFAMYGTLAVTLAALTQLPAGFH